MNYKLGLPYQLNAAFYYDTMLDHYEELLSVAKNCKQITFITQRLETLLTSRLQILN